MMKLGMICASPDPQTLEYIKGLGLSFIELCTNNDAESNRCHDNFASIMENTRAAGLTIGSIGRWNSKMNVGGKINEEAFAVVEKNLEDAIACGAPTFVCGCNYDDSVSLYRNYSAAIEIFGRMLDRARGTGVKVAAYNCSWENFIDTPDAWKIVLGELPDLMIKYDPSHSYHAGREYLREMGDWGNRIAHVHIKGCVRTGGSGVSDPPAGMDDLRWPAIFAILYARHYDGCLSIEPHSAAWQFNTDLGKAGVRYTINYIRQFML